MNNNNEKHSFNDLPAIIYHDTTMEYWINGKKILSEEKRKINHYCIIYFDIIKDGIKYMMFSFSEEHVFTYESLENFENEKCLYCSNKLIDKIFIQDFFAFKRLTQAIAISRLMNNNFYL
jgi:hypothetical protein